MARFIIIDDWSGYVFGDTADMDGPARDEMPIEACRRLDAYNGNDVEHARYKQHGPKYQCSGSAYHVYRADIDGSEVLPVIEDGQDMDVVRQIESTCRKMAVVTVERYR